MLASKDSERESDEDIAQLPKIDCIDSLTM